MKLTLLSLVILAISAASAVAADTVDVNGTWSGTWVKPGGMREPVTVQLRQEPNGNLTGKFLTPVAMDFKKMSFIAKTGAVVLEAMDEQSGTHYKIDAKIQGTELKGSLLANEVAGELDLVKWTYVPRTY